MSWLMFGLAMILGAMIGTIITGSILVDMLDRQQKRFDLEKEAAKHKKH